MPTLEQKRRAAAALMIILMNFSILYCRLRRRRRFLRAPYRNRDQERSAIFARMYSESDRLCHKNLRMKILPFNRLCARLRACGLVDSRFVSVKEQVAIFLYTVGHNIRLCNSELHFFRSTQTVSHYFHLVLRALVKLYKEVVKPATKDNSPADGSYEQPWHHHFKDAVGAIDGTHIEANIPLNDQPSYRNRKGFISQNVLVACTFDMKFTYAMVGFEGSAHDGRLLRSAVAPRERRLTVPTGKFYLADSGFPNVRGFLTPYRGQRYHVTDQQGRRARNAKELYNYYHSQLRNVIERTIGLLKKRFAYLRNTPFHDIDTQEKIVIACCALHNFIRDGDPSDICEDDSSESESEDEDEEEVDEEEDNEDIVIQRSAYWTAKRDAMALDMFQEFQLRNQH